MNHSSIDESRTIQMFHVKHFNFATRGTLCVRKTCQHMAKKKKREQKPNDEYHIGKNNPPLHTRFSSTNQPPRYRSKEREQLQTDRNTIKSYLNARYHLDDDSELKKDLVRAFGFVVEDMSAGQIMILRLIQCGIIKGDVIAFEKLFNHAFGTPPQEIRAATVSQMLIRVEHDKSEIIDGIASDINPVD